MRQRNAGLFSAVWLLSLCAPAFAQEKYDPFAPPPPPPPAPAYRAPMPVAPPRPAMPPMPGMSAGPAEQDQAAVARATQLPLSDSDKGLRNQLPADVAGTTQQLGLRVPQGQHVPVSPTPSPSELVNALSHQ